MSIESRQSQQFSRRRVLKMLQGVALAPFAVTDALSQPSGMAQELPSCRVDPDGRGINGKNLGNLQSGFDTYYQGGEDLQQVRRYIEALDGEMCDFVPGSSDTDGAIHAISGGKFDTYESLMGDGQVNQSVRPSEPIAPSYLSTNVPEAPAAGGQVPTRIPLQNLDSNAATQSENTGNPTSSTETQSGNGLGLATAVGFGVLGLGWIINRRNKNRALNEPNVSGASYVGGPQKGPGIGERVRGLIGRIGYNNKKPMDNWSRDPRAPDRRKVDTRDKESLAPNLYEDPRVNARVQIKSYKKMTERTLVRMGRMRRMGFDVRAYENDLEGYLEMIDRYEKIANQQDPDSAREVERELLAPLVHPPESD